MTEETEIVQEETPVQEEQIAQVEAQEEAQTESKRNVDHNWDQVRQVLQYQKQEIEELKYKLSEKEQPIQKDEFADLDPDDYVTVDKAKKLAEKMAEKKAMETASKVVKEYAFKHQLEMEEGRLRGKYDDYDYVVENFAIPMIKNDPALAQYIQSSKNPAETAYKLAKLSDNYEGTIMKQQVSPKAEKILKNSSRPASSNAVGGSLKTQADDFSKMSPEKIWEMSQKYAKRV